MLWGAAGGDEPQDPIEEAWRWRFFNTQNTDQGLPSNAVHCLFEAREGTIYAGTDRGLSSYDGYFWRAIRTGPRMESDPILGIYESRDGDIYFHSEKMAWRLTNGSVREVARGDERILLQSDPHGVVHGIMGRTLFHFAGDSIVYDPGPIPPESRARDFRIDADGHLWLATEDGLYRRGAEEWEMELDVEKLARAAGYDGPESKPVPCMRIFELGDTLWVNMGRPGFRRQIIARNAGQWIPPPAGAPVTVITAIAGIPKVAVYATDTQGKAYRFRGGRWETLEEAGPRWPVKAMISDRHAVLWFGFASHGIGRFSATSSRWRRYTQHLIGNRVNTIVVGADGTIWVGSEEGFFRIRERRVEPVPERGFPPGLTLRAITSAIEDHRKKIWVSSGSTFQGVAELDPRDGRWAYISGSGEFANFRIHRIRTDRNGNLWLCSIGPYRGEGEEFGAIRYDALSRIASTIGPAAGLVHGRVYDVYHASDGRYWFATLGGLHRMEMDALGTPRFDEPPFTRSNGLLADRVFSIEEDPGGAIWIAYQEGLLGVGLFRDDRWHHLDERDGLSHSNVWSINRAPNGDLWFGTEAGVSRHDGDTFHNYPVGEGGALGVRVERPALVWPIAFVPTGSRAHPEEADVLIGTDTDGIFRLRLDDTDPPRLYPAVLPPVVQAGLAVTFRWSGRDFGDWTPQDRLLYRSRIDGDEWSPWSPGTARSVEGLWTMGLHRIEVEARDLDGNVCIAPLDHEFRVSWFAWEQHRIAGTALAGYGALLLLVLWIWLRARRHRRMADLHRRASRSLPSLTVWIDRRGVIVEAGTILQPFSHLGLRSRAPVSDTVLGQVPPLRDAIDRALLGDPADAWGEVTGKDGRPLLLEVEAAPLRGEEVAGAVVRITDLSRVARGIREKAGTPPGGTGTAPPTIPGTIPGASGPPS